MIDCRNLELALYQTNSSNTFKGKAQKELDNLETIVYLPVADRYLETAYNETSQEEIKRKTASRYTTFYGTNIAQTISNIQNYFFSAMLYGSYTHMCLARDSLANLLYKYAYIIENPSLIYQAIRLNLLNGNQKIFTQMIQHEWDNVYSFVTANSDAMWELCDSVPIPWQDIMKQTVLSVLGLYLSDKQFAKAEKYIESFSKKVYWGNSEDYFDCISKDIVKGECKI